MTGNVQPLYADQLLTLVEAFRRDARSDRTSARDAISMLLLNAQSDDGTDCKLDWLSIALCRVVMHNVLPGVRDGLPLDPFALAELDGLVQREFPLYYQPHLVEWTVNMVLGTDPPVETGMAQDAELSFGLLNRVALSVLVLEELCDQTGARFEDAMQEFFLLTVGMMGYWRDVGQIPADWDLPVVW